MKTTVDILREARELIATPDRWVKRTYRTPDGLCHCLSGAIRVAAGVGFGKLRNMAPPLKEAILTIADSIGTTDAVAWNDDPSRTHAEVLAAFDEAIARAEEEA